jgi:hypothetical protein
MMNLKNALAFTTILSGLVLGMAPAFSQCVEVGAGVAYNTSTSETVPVVNGKCKIATNVVLEPFVKFNKDKTTYGGDVSYRFTNYTNVTPSLGLGLESGNRGGYSKFGVQLNTPVLLDVNFKVPFNNAQAPEVSLIANYSF